MPASLASLEITAELLFLCRGQGGQIGPPILRMHADWQQMAPHNLIFGIIFQVDGSNGS